MSTKAYNAFQLKDPSTFWAFTRDVQQRARRAAKAKLRELYLELSKSVDTSSQEYEKARRFWGTAPKARICMVHDLLTKGYLEATRTSQNHPFDFDTWVRFFEHDGEVYGQSHEPPHLMGTFDFLKRSSSPVRDFSYWDNTDPPKGMSEAKWAHRSAVWDAIDKQFVPIAMNIVSWDTFYHVDPWLDLCHDIRDGKLKLPPIAKNRE